MFKRTLLMAALLGLSSAALADPVSYALDPAHTNVVASWSHLGFSNPVAHFGDVDGTLVYDADDVAASSVEVSIPLTGIDGHTEAFNEHLRSPDLFDAARYPTIEFTSTQVEAIGDKALRVTGDLTIKGITRPAVLDVTLNGQGEHPMAAGKQAIGFDATTTIKRSDYGIAYAIPAVSDSIGIRITTEALTNGEPGN